MRALIVDDSFRIRQDLRNLLTKLGWTVVGECENGMQALVSINELQPDLVILDIIMPEMDGIECYRKMRLLENPPHCLLVSALASEPRVIQAFEKEIMPNHFLKKPVVEREFAERVKEVMSMPPLPIPMQLEGEVSAHSHVPPPPPSSRN